MGDDMEQVGRSVAIDGTGNIVVAGDFAGSVDFGGGVMVAGGDRDLFLVRDDASPGGHKKNEPILIAVKDRFGRLP